MFDVLTFVYENYWAADNCPELPTLQRTLNAVGFADHEVLAALLWLEELQCVTRQVPPPAVAQGPTPRAGAVLATHQAWAASAGATRVFTAAEKDRLGVHGWGLLTFLKDAGALDHGRLEMVMERALAAPGNPISLEDLKLIVLMLYWSLGEEPDTLLSDELCGNSLGRLAN
jgi:Smg protein